MIQTRISINAAFAQLAFVGLVPLLKAQTNSMIILTIGIIVKISEIIQIQIDIGE